MKDNYNISRFFSDELKDTGAPVAHDYINETSEMEIIQAAVKNEITNIQYDINGAKVLEAAPIIALSTSVRNDSDGEASQTLACSYEKWKVGTWNNSARTEIGQTTSFKVSSAKFEISISAQRKSTYERQNHRCPIK